MGLPVLIIGKSGSGKSTSLRNCQGFGVFNVIDMSRLPSEFLKYSEPTADKTAIKAAIKEGKEVAGAEILVKNNLQIK